jgi:hypothetical protein
MTKGLGIGGLALALMAGGAAAQTAEPGGARIEAAADGATLYFAGDIDIGGYNAFHALAMAHRSAKRLVISSPGGEVMAARLMASVVNRQHLAVHVEHLCASACTIVLMASPDRSVGPAARIGFHQSYIPTPPPKPAKEAADSKISANRARAQPETQAPGLFGDAMMRRIMADAGVDTAFIDHALSTPPDDMWYPAAEELLAAKAVTRREAAVPDAGPSWAIDRAEAAAALVGPLWEALQHHRPQQWTQATDDIWRERNSGRSGHDALAIVRDTWVNALMHDAARAPDALVARLLDVQAQRSRQARANGYRTCMASYAPSPAEAAADAAISAREDAVLAELLALTRWKKAMSEDKAADLIATYLFDYGTGGQSPSVRSADERDCREGTRVLERIAAQPGKERIRLFRALLTFY